MLKEATDKQRAIRFYRWVASDAEREVRQQYPLLRRIQNVEVLNYLQATEFMHIEEQLRLFRALINWGNSAARGLQGQELSIEEKLLREDYCFEARLRVSTIERHLSEQSVIGKPYNRKRFARIMVEKLEPVFGPSKYDGTCWTFITPIPGWYVGTRVQLLEGRNAFRYWQSIMAKPDEYPGMLESPSQNGTNILSWFGFSRKEIEIPNEQDEESTAETLSVLCQHYLNALPSVLEGLTAEVMEEGEWDGIHWWQRRNLNSVYDTGN